MKKTKVKKNKAGKNTLLSGAAKSLKKLRTAKLSTTQKVVGGAALVALGLSYLSKRLNGADISAPKDATTTADAPAAEASLAAMGGNA